MTPRYVMIGGFLGAGKTTAILKLAQYLHGKGQRVGLITNDQSYGLVDTALLNAHGFDVEEITGGCFCCKFNSLMEASERLSRETRPDVFIAEPVGSCTDLRAAVSYPLRRIYGEHFTIVPLSVLVDPIRALRILNIEEGKAFSNKVLYVYGKQLEEAEIIVINKCDLLTRERLEKLQQALQARYPKAEVHVASARDGTGLESWFDQIIDSEEKGTTPAPDVDYELYAEGEALLGWLNCTVMLESADSFDGNAFLQNIAGEIKQKLSAQSLEIAHLKMTLTPDEGNDIAVVNLVRNDGEAEVSHSLQEALELGELIINLRAEGDPKALKDTTTLALDTCAQRIGRMNVKIEHIEHFRPAKPTPTYRMATA